MDYLNQIQVLEEENKQLDKDLERLRAELSDIIVVATEEASNLSYESGYEDIVKIAKDALGNDKQKTS